jgi:hypothetical protein
MAKSIKQVQAELLDEGLLNRLGATERDITELPVLEQLMIRAAANFILKVKENIEVLGISDTGALSDDLAQGDFIKQGNTYSIEMGYPSGSKAAKYYDFVNKGVTGVRSGSPNSPYRFKTLGVGKGMALNILQWVRRNNVKGDVALSKGQSKRQSLSKMVSEASRKKSLAYAIAVNIKKRGLRKTGFFDQAKDLYFGNDFATAISKIIGQDVRILIRQNGNSNQ